MELSASLARDAGDVFSDIDVGVADPDWPAATVPSAGWPNWRRSPIVDRDGPIRWGRSWPDADVPSLPEDRGHHRRVDPLGLRTAGLALADVLEELRGELPPIGEWVGRRLRSLRGG